MQTSFVIAYNMVISKQDVDYGVLAQILSLPKLIDVEFVLKI